MKIKTSIPNFITIGNLLSGCVATFMAFHHTEAFGGLTGLQWAWIWIGVAAICDFCDGASARGLHAYSEIGKELDSLSDLISFGLAPAMLLMNVMQEHSSWYLLSFIAFLIPACGALRLAKFNVDTEQTTVFKGLPIPANAIFWIGYTGWIEEYGYPNNFITTLLVIVISTMMISDFKMFSLKFKTFGITDNFYRYVILLAAVMFCVMWQVSGLVWVILTYTLLSLFGRKEN